MAKSGVERYDALPARVGFIDVDVLRDEFQRLSHRLETVRGALDWAVERHQDKLNKEADA